MIDPGYLFQQGDEIKHLVDEIEDAYHRLVDAVGFLLSIFYCELSYDFKFIDELNAAKATAMEFISANQIMIQRVEEVISDMNKPFEIGIDHYYNPYT